MQAKNEKNVGTFWVRTPKARGQEGENLSGLGAGSPVWEKKGEVSRGVEPALRHASLVQGRGRMGPLLPAKRVTARG